MVRTYKGVRLKKHRVYTVDDLMESYQVTQNTVSNWVQTGLQPSDKKRPYMFRGGVVNEFHEARRARSRLQLRPGEFKCVSCKLAVFPTEFATDEKPTKSGASLVRARCPECSASALKLCSDADLAVLSGRANPNFSEDLAHEEKHSVPSDVGISERTCGTVNDRTIYNWQLYAKRHSEKTIDRHLGAIRFFEACVGPKPFEQLSLKDVAKFRDVLKEALSPESSTPLSKSTVQHTASHVRAFLNWLLKQDGYRRLPKDLADYVVLPRAACAASLPPKARPYPSILEARELLNAMPTSSLTEKRDKAIFAIAFLGALRADTAISLRLGDVDLERKRINQDARRVRAKMGKSLIIAWFPIPTEFEDTVIDWCKTLEKAGFGSEDALFPASQHLQHGLRYAKLGGKSIVPMRSIHAVEQAFQRASAGSERRYTPHAAKHTIAHERNARPLNEEQRRAWSLNMGHETEHITETYYAKMSDKRRFDVLESITDDTESTPVAALSDEELGALFRSVLDAARCKGSKK